MKYEVGQIFVHGNDAVVVYSSHGTHKGDLMGKPPTDKPIGYLAAHHVTWGTDGLIATDRHYYDQGTFTGQLGMHEMPVRAVREPGKWGETEVVIAKNDKTEKANLAVYKKFDQLGRAKDVDKLMELYADDAVFAYMATQEDAKGKEAVKKSFEQWFKVSSDVKGKTAWSWAAGDYVLAAGSSSGTNDGELGEGKPATNKKFSMKALEILKLKDGKITEHWMYGNGFKFAVDLGLAENPAAAMAKKDDDKGDDPAEEEKKAAAKDAPKDKAPDTKAAGAKPEPKPASTPKKPE
jgi:ketosteroid isomerase-like protein